MKVLVFAHRLDIGGTQTNAIELAASVAERAGHEIVMFAAPGPAEQLAIEHRVQLIRAPDARRHPSLNRVLALSQTVRAYRPDLIHAWDWPQCFDAYYLEHMIRGVPVLCTVMGMIVPSFIPRALPTTFGTPQLQSLAQKQRQGRVELLEPPVDLRFNAPGAVDAAAFKREYNLDDTRLTMVVVSRLTRWRKLEGIVSAIKATQNLARSGCNLRLVIVGEGPAREQLEQVAGEANRQTGPGTIILTGGLIDPRPAYEAADLVLGMGGSALRALAFAKPLIVMGEQGFSKIFSPETVDLFVWQGYYGLGEDNDGSGGLQNQIESLVSSSDRRAALAAFGRSIVEQRYGLDDAADRLALLYEDVGRSESKMPRRVYEGGRTAAYLAARGLRGVRSRVLKRE